MVDFSLVSVDEKNVDFNDILDDLRVFYRYKMYDVSSFLCVCFMCFMCRSPFCGVCVFS